MLYAPLRLGDGIQGTGVGPNIWCLNWATPQALVQAWVGSQWEDAQRPTFG